MKWYRLAAAQNDAQAQHNVGYSYYNGQGVELDYVEAVKWFRKASDQDYAPAQYQLGLSSFNGHGVTKSFVEAYAWWNLAADTHALAAQGRTALGQKMTPDQLFDAHKRTRELRAEIAARRSKAVETHFVTLKAEAETGDGRAQSALGVIYCGAKDYPQAVKWYRKAAEQNDASAQYNLGICHDRGAGVTKDSTEAVKWYRKAAEQNHADAQHNLGISYHLGEGVVRDDVEAYAWTDLAAKTVEEAKANRDDLRKRMSPQQIAAGEKRAKELRAQIEARLESAGKTKPPRP